MIDGVGSEEGKLFFATVCPPDPNSIHFSHTFISDKLS